MRRTRHRSLRGAAVLAAAALSTPWGAMMGCSGDERRSVAPRSPAPLAAASEPAAPPPSIVPDLAWPEAIMPFDEAVLRFCGGDGAASAALPGDRTLWLFGDSCIAAVRDGRYQPGWWMTNNVAAVGPTPAPGTAPTRGSVVARFGERPEPGRFGGFVVPPRVGPDAADAAQPRAPDRWCWPCDAALLVGPPSSPRLVVFYADLARRVENPEPADGWNFRFVGNRVAVIENPQDDLAEWRVVQHPLLPRDPARMTDGSPRISWGVVAMHEPKEVAAMDPDAPVAAGRRVLVFGVDGSNAFDKRAVVARVDEASIHDFSAWRFWTGTEWSDRESQAVAVVDGVVDEFTIHRSPAGGAGADARWTMIQGEPLLGHRILVRHAPSPLGPWSAGRPIYTIPEPKEDANVIVYGAKGHPHLSAPGELLVSYSVNALDFGRVPRDVELYRPRFLRVPLALIE